MRSRSASIRRWRRPDFGRESRSGTRGDRGQREQGELGLARAWHLVPGRHEMPSSKPSAFTTRRIASDGGRQFFPVRKFTRPRSDSRQRARQPSVHAPRSGHETPARRGGAGKASQPRSSGSRRLREAHASPRCPRAASAPSSVSATGATLSCAVKKSACAELHRSDGRGRASGGRLVERDCELVEMRAAHRRVPAVDHALETSSIDSSAFARIAAQSRYERRHGHRAERQAPHAARRTAHVARPSPAEITRRRA